MYAKRPHITKLWPVFARTITDALSNKGPASERVTPSVHVRTLSFPSVPSTMSNKMLNGTKIATAIHNATEDSMQPVPGYVFQEIVNTTLLLNTLLLTITRLKTYIPDEEVSFESYYKCSESFIHSFVTHCNRILRSFKWLVTEQE